MSNLRHLHTTPARWRACALIAAIAADGGARAHAEENPIEAWARSVETPHYHGPLVPFPETSPRPNLDGVRLRSQHWPLVLHADAGVPRERAERALRALEDAYAWAREQAWPLPYPDGGYGGGLDFDLYLAAGVDHAADAGADVPTVWTGLDGATTYALVDSAVADAELPACTLSALVQAGLLGADPAETASVRRAGAAFATWLATGELGCEDARLQPQQAPELGTIGSDDAQVAALAGWFAMLSQRHDRGRGDFVRGIFELARQQSDSAIALHAQPNVWQALAAALAKAGELIDDSAEELAIERYFAPERKHDSPLPPLPPTARVPVLDAPGWDALPKHLPERDPGLRTYGSAYTRIDVHAAPAGARLHAWLRGDPDVRWSFVAIRLDAQGHELGRVAAPPRRVPQSYLPIELTPETRQVLLVVTELPWRLPIEPAPDDPAPTFRLILSNTETLSNAAH